MPRELPPFYMAFESTEPLNDQCDDQCNDVCIEPVNQIQVANKFLRDSTGDFFLLIMMTMIVIIISKLIYDESIKRKLKKTITKSNNLEKIKLQLEKKQKTLEKQEELATLINKNARVSDKRWDEKNDDVEVDEEYIKQLAALIDELDVAIHFDSTPDLTITDKLDTKEETKKIIKPRKNTLYAKKSRPAELSSTTLTMITPSNDDSLSQFPIQPVYELKKGKGFVVINPYLRAYLKLNHPEELERLIKLCEKGKVELVKKSKRTEGFVIRTEEKVKKIKQGKVEEKDRKYYIKAKPYHNNARTFGESEVFNFFYQRHIFELHRFKLDHKDRTTTYFPSAIKK